MLKKKAGAAIGWGAADQLVQQFISFSVSIVLARLIAPEVFGTIALLSLFIAIAGVFVDGGLTQSLIQKKDLSYTDESTVFWYNLAIASLLGAGLYFAAPWISSFYGIPILTFITRIYAFIFFLAAFNSVQNTLFIRRLDFKTPLKINTAATVIASLTAILCAASGLGIWALVLQATLASVLRTFMIWWISPWRPSRAFSTDSFRNLFRFGGYLFLSGLLDTAYQQLYTLFIGKWYGVHDLGIYNRANSTRQIPSTTISSVLNRVAFPLFSQLQNDQHRLLRGFRLAIRGAMFINIPVMLGIATVAEPLILSLFGPSWVASAPLLKILALAGVLMPLQVLNLSVMKAMGHSALFLRVEVVKKSVGLLCIVIGASFGLVGLAWAVVVASSFSFLFNAYFNGKLLHYGSWKQILDFMPSLICGIVMAGFVMVLDHYIHLFAPLQLAILSTSGLVIYLSMAKLCRIGELDEAFSLIGSYISRIRRQRQ